MPLWFNYTNNNHECTSALLIIAVGSNNLTPFNLCHGASLCDKNDQWKMCTAKNKKKITPKWMIYSRL